MRLGVRPARPDGVIGLLARVAVLAAVVAGRIVAYPLWSGRPRPPRRRWPVRGTAYAGWVTLVHWLVGAATIVRYWRYGSCVSLMI
ncbi:hypothetical protein [Nitriliruptor alkaliphilus]|uniref:hypothetical protein n=1 Tax=Nitriliruptor alkaliphilus TaxID=427918 RepID=UPI0006967EDD|nr:hypothetical protein [Nitriliruptor alkaliphilus]